MFAALPPGNQHGVSEAAIRNEWVARGYSTIGVDVCNASAQDLASLGLLQGVSSVGAEPWFLSFTRSLTSANAQVLSAHRAAIVPYVIKVVSGPRLPERNGIGRSLRIAFVGLTNRSDSADSETEIERPLAALNRVLHEVKRQSDLVIILADLKEPAISELVTKSDEDIDIIIANTGQRITPSARAMGHTLVIYSSDEGRELGWLEICFDGQKGARYLNHLIPMDRYEPDEPSAAKIAAQAHEAFTRVQKTTVPVSKKEATLRTAVYVTAGKCAECHLDQYMVWAQTRHAHALETLKRNNQERDARCVACHTTGYSHGGFVDAEQTPEYGSVQCEVCHGPGVSHVKSPSQPYGRDRVSEKRCVLCHTRERSPEFEVASFWAHIKH